MQILAALHERELDYYANVTSLDLYGNLIMSGRMRFFLRFYYWHAPQPQVDCWGYPCSLRQMWTSSIPSLFSRALPVNHFFVLDCFLNSFILVLSLFVWTFHSLHTLEMSFDAIRVSIQKKVFMRSWNQFYLILLTAWLCQENIFLLSNRSKFQYPWLDWLYNWQLHVVSYMKLLSFWTPESSTSSIT